jgi:hypothetical protein
MMASGISRDIIANAFSRSSGSRPLKGRTTTPSNPAALSRGGRFLRCASLAMCKSCDLVLAGTSPSLSHAPYVEGFGGHAPPTSSDLILRSRALRAASRRMAASPCVSNRLKMTPFFVMAGLVPAHHVFLASMKSRRGCPGQARA